MALNPYEIDQAFAAGQNRFARQQQLAQVQEAYALGTPARLDALRQQQRQRDAAAYIAPMFANQQTSGLPLADYFIQQRQTVLNDPNFKAFDPETQSAILQQLGSSATVAAKGYYDSGQHDQAQRIYNAFGLQNEVPDAAVTAQSGNIDTFLPSFNKQFGSNYVLSPDKQFVLNPDGSKLPVQTWLAVASMHLGDSTPYLAQATQDYINAQTAIGQQNAQKAEATAMQQRIARATLEAQYAGSGYTHVGPNQWKSPTGQIVNLDPALVGQDMFVAPPATTTPVTPAQGAGAAAPGAGAPGAGAPGAALSPFQTLLAQQASLSNQLVQTQQDMENADRLYQQIVQPSVDAANRNPGFLQSTIGLPPTVELTPAQQAVDRLRQSAFLKRNALQDRLSEVNKAVDAARDANPAQITVPNLLASPELLDTIAQTLNTQPDAVASFTGVEGPLTLLNYAKALQAAIDDPATPAARRAAYMTAVNKLYAGLRGTP